MESGYAARVSDLHTLASVTRDIIRRWTFPMVPDSNLLVESSYRMSRNNVYRDAGVDMPRTAVIGGDTIVGRNTCIGDKTFVAKVCEFTRNHLTS